MEGCHRTFAGPLAEAWDRACGGSGGEGFARFYGSGSFVVRVAAIAGTRGVASLYVAGGRGRWRCSAIADNICFIGL